MTIGNNVYDENLHKLKKRNILNTILIVQVVLLGLYSLVLQRYWNTPNETNEKCKFDIIHCQLLILALVCVCMISCSVMSDSLQSHRLQPTRLLCLWHFPVKNWSGLPSPTSGNLPNPGIEPTSLVSPVLASGFFPTVPPGKPHWPCSFLESILDIYLQIHNLNRIKIQNWFIIQLYSITNAL